MGSTRWLLKNMFGEIYLKIRGLASALILGEPHR